MIVDYYLSKKKRNGKIDGDLLPLSHMLCSSGAFNGFDSDLSRISWADTILYLWEDNFNQYRCTNIYLLKKELTHIFCTISLRLKEII